MLCITLIPAVTVHAVKEEHEWNNNRKRADVIRLNDVYLGSFRTFGDLDVFKYVPEESGEVWAELTPEDNKVTSRLWILDADWGYAAASEKGTEKHFVKKELKAGQTYYIVVEAIDFPDGGKVNCNYKLTLYPPHEFIATTNYDIASYESIEEMALKSDLVATVRAVDSHIDVIQNNVYTVTEMEIIDVIRGDYKGDTVDVKIIGGGVNDDTLYISENTEYFIDGRTYLVFLKLYENSPASMLTFGAEYYADGLKFTSISGNPVDFSIETLWWAGKDCIDTGIYRTDADDYFMIYGTGFYERYDGDASAFKKGKLLGEIKSNTESRIYKNIESWAANKLPVGTKIYAEKKNGEEYYVLAEVNGELIPYRAIFEG